MTGGKDKMLMRFPELATGGKALSRDGIEYISEVSLRHPFGMSKNTGRVEIITACAGSKAYLALW